MAIYVKLSLLMQIIILETSRHSCTSTPSCTPRWAQFFFAIIQLSIGHNSIWCDTTLNEKKILWGPKRIKPTIGVQRLRVLEFPVFMLFVFVTQKYINWTDLIQWGNHHSWLSGHVIVRIWVKDWPDPYLQNIKIRIRSVSKNGILHYKTGFRYDLIE